MIADEANGGSASPVTERRRTIVAMFAIFTIALLVRFAFWSELRGTPLDRWHLFPGSDMATYLEQARRFAEGDWLGREPYYPYHGWQSVAPPERWLVWYGPHAFNQAPLYAYALALAGRVLADPLPLVKSIQLVLGAIASVLALLLTRRLAGFGAACVAGVAVALYAPRIQLETQILREGPALCALFAILWLILDAIERPPGSHPLKWLRSTAFAGIALGVFHMFHELGGVLAGMAMVAIAAAAIHDATIGRVRAAALALAVLFAGYTVGFAPLLARNLAAGAPPFSVSCRARINFVEANVADAAYGGSRFAPPGPSVARILDEAGDSGVGAIAGVWRSYQGDWRRATGNLWLRFAAIWKWYEEPDNTSFEFYREWTRTLRGLPTFGMLFPLGVAGAVLALATGSWRTSPRGHALLLVFLAVMVASLSFMHVVGRFRQYVTPFFFVYAGIAVAIAFASVRRKRLGPVVLAIGAAGAAIAFQRAVTHAQDGDRFRFVDYGVAESIAVADGQLEQARAFADRGVRDHLHDADLYALLGHELERAQEPGRAADAYRAALAMAPDHADALAGLARATASTPEAKP